MDPIQAKISPEQLGALTANGMVELEADTRRGVRVRLESRSNEVWNKIYEDEDGEEYDVLVFPDDMFEQVLESVGAEGDKVKINGMIWLSESDV